jgi:ubiquinone/menaquinone biosynthesis C-methylase UbiE/uncharacterized protein YbaR (Trm112 family)
MKFRLLDLLQCPSCGSRNIGLNDVVTKRVPSGDSFTRVRCKEMCGIRRCRVAQGNPKPTDCTECYTQEIMEGTLCCECGQKWPIVNGIPRFLPKQLADDFRKTQATFSFEWKMFRFGERNWGQDISVRKDLFLRGMGVGRRDVKGGLIFDAGCGSGLLSMEMAKSFGMEVVALDLAFGIEQAYEKNRSPYVHFVQGSVLEPPLQDGVFDYLYCAGVLVALPDTRAGFKSIIRTLRQGGRCFIWVYHPIDSVHHPDDLNKMRLYNWIRRKITSRLPIRLQYILYLSLMPPFLAKQSIEKFLGINMTAQTWREKMQAMFDFFSPLYQNRHEESEVVEWFSAEGFSNVAVAYKEQYGFAARGDSPSHAKVPSAPDRDTALVGISKVPVSSNEEIRDAC